MYAKNKITIYAKNEIKYHAGVLNHKKYFSTIYRENKINRRRR